MLQFIFGVFIGGIFPLLYRVWDRTQLKSWIEIYNGWEKEDGSHDSDLVDLRNLIKSNLKNFQKENNHSRIATQVLCGFFLFVVLFVSSIIAFVDTNLQTFFVFVGVGLFGYVLAKVSDV